MGETLKKMYVYRVFIPTVNNNADLDKPSAVFAKKYDAMDSAIYYGESSGKSVMIDKFLMSDKDDYSRVWNTGYQNDSKVEYGLPLSRFD